MTDTIVHQSNELVDTSVRGGNGRLHPMLDQTQPYLVERQSPFAFETSDMVDLITTERDEQSGLMVHHLAVEDRYLRLFDGYPEMRDRVVAERGNVINAMDELELFLRANPGDEYNEGAAEFIYDSSPGMLGWRKLIPSAKALYPLQIPEDPVLPNDERTRIDEFARLMFAHSVDAIGIRSRATAAQAMFIEHAMKSGKKNLEWLSLACGAAVPVFGGSAGLRHIAPGINVHMTLVDADPGALQFAQELAGSRRFRVRPQEYTIVQSNLVKELMYKDTLAEQYGRGKADMIDLLGIFEYFDDNRAALLLKKAYELLGDDGLLVFGNMLASHPQLEVNQRAVQWPGIKPRDLERIKNIIEMSGVDGAVDVFIPEDGVYAVVSIKKQAAPGAEMPVVPEVQLNGHRRPRRFGAAVVNAFSHLNPRRNGRYNGHSGDGDFPKAA